MITNTKKYELRKIIDAEHGKDFSKNIDLSGWTFYRGSSFISFKILSINDINTAVIKYVYITNKDDLVKLLATCMNFWELNQVQMIYLLEHKRVANYVKKYFVETLGFDLIDEVRPGVWAYNFKSTNGYKEEDILEYFV